LDRNYERDAESILAELLKGLNQVFDVDEPLPGLLNAPRHKDEVESGKRDMVDTTMTYVTSVALVDVLRLPTHPSEIDHSYQPTES
jgi:hypothetical protein